MTDVYSAGFRGGTHWEVSVEVQVHGGWFSSGLSMTNKSSEVWSRSCSFGVRNRNYSTEAPLSWKLVKLRNQSHQADDHSEGECTIFYTTSAVKRKFIMFPSTADD